MKVSIGTLNCGCTTMLLSMGVIHCVWETLQETLFQNRSRTARQLSDFLVNQTGTCYPSCIGFFIQDFMCLVGLQVGIQVRMLMSLCHDVVFLLMWVSMWLVLVQLWVYEGGGSRCKCRCKVEQPCSSVVANWHAVHEAFLFRRHSKGSLADLSHSFCV